MMLNEIYLDALRIIYERLQATEINWVITGSMGLILKGIDVAVHDIDLQTDRQGAYAIEQRFAAQMVRPVTFSATGNIRSHFGEFALNGIKVEIMGDIQNPVGNDWTEPVDLNKHKQWVDMAGMQLPTLTLAYEHAAYLRLGRVEKAALLQKQLARLVQKPGDDQHYQRHD